MGVGLCRVREVLSGRPGNTNQVGVMVFLDVAPVTTGTRSQGKIVLHPGKGAVGYLIPVILGVSAAGAIYGPL